jgi:hypothetical protein
MDRSLVFARCQPQDFINPFPPLVQSVALCAALLLGMTVLLWLSRVIARPALALRWLRWASTGVLALMAGVLLLAALLAFWLWGLDTSFHGWCSIGPTPQLANEANMLLLGQRLVPVAILVTGIILLVGMVTLVMLLVMRFRGGQTPLQAGAGRG